MGDFTISAEIVPKGRKVSCRYKWLEDCKKSGGRFMKTGQKYLAIRSWASGGSVTIGICEHHAEDFFKQVAKAKKDLKKL